MSDSNSGGNWDNSSSGGWQGMPDGSQQSGDNWTEGGSGDSFSETTHKSWLERITESIKAILIGFAFVIGGCVLLFWNEGNSAKTAAALTEGAGLVISVSSERPDPANEGKLVHVAGETKAGSPARDPDLGFGGNGLRLVRKVEMLQWKEDKETETRTRLGGGEETVTRYVYKREWSETPISSGNFRDGEGHRNPPMPQTRSRGFAAENATLDGFRLAANVIDLLGKGETYDIPAGVAAQARERFGQRAVVRNGQIYAGDPGQPRVGDIRVTYTLLAIQPVSVVGRQMQGGFSAYTTSNQRTILLAETGIKDSALLFKHAQDANMVLTWILRLFGVIIVFAGFRAMLSLLEVIASVIPIFGDIVGMGASVIALLATAIVAPIVIAVAWFFYRPLTAALVLAGGVAIFYGLRVLATRRAETKRLEAGAGGLAGPAFGNPGMGFSSSGAGAQSGGQGPTFGRRGQGKPSPFLQSSQPKRSGGFLPPGFGKKK